MKSRIIILFSLLSTVFMQYSQAQTSSQNYIRTRTMTNESGTSFVEQVDYYDGLGRLLETVQAKAGGNSQDLIVLTDYDSYGRKDKIWLPVAVNTNNSNYVAPSTLRSNAPGFNANDSKPYSQIIYEASPLNRTMKEFGPGNNWYANNRAIHTTYLTNNSSYPCALFSSSSNGTTISITRSGTYANNTLFVTKYQDEDNNISYEFKDKQDRILLTRQVNGSTNFDTYYIYDDYGNLRVVLSPLASDVFTSNTTWNESNATLQKYAYLYKYDNRNRCIAKKLPGADWTYHVYDNADRLIFSQDGEQRLRSEWSFNIPDRFGRIAINGICKNSFSYSSNPLNGKVINAVWATNGTGTYKGYNLEGGISLTNAIIQNINYYDSYEFIGKNNVPSSLTFESRSGYATTYLSTPKGLLTGQITSELGNNSTLYYSVNYYDSRSRLILNRSTNHLAGIDKEFLSYAFDNNVEKRCHIQTVSGKTQTEEYAYTYDQARRLKNTSHTLNGGSSRMLSEKIYDDLGRLQSEKLGGFDMLKAAYNYDVRNRLIRNWCAQMGEVLTYTYGSNVQTQSIALGTGTRIYEYAYDGLSRVTSGAYTSGPGDYTSSYSYDKNGNPLTVKRNGLISTGVFGIVDNLTFSYDGNHIVSINDAAGNIAYNFSHDFKNYSNQSVEYIYNANGCMTKDLNRGISEIQYNSLNLPSRIDIKSPVGEARNEYLYSSDGQKLRVKHSWNPNYSSSPIIGSGVTVSSLSSIETTDYIGDYEYVNNTLKRIRTEYGYIEGGVYHFYVKDHLGSNRLVVSEPMSSQAVNYYPFGMANGDQRAADLQSYKYTGKELDMKQGLNLYDYGARYYDPASCRFTTMDPMAEMYYSISPYAYCANNPLNAVDPSGMAIDWYGLDEFTGVLKKIKETTDDFDLIKSGTFDQKDNFLENNSVDPLKISKGQLIESLHQDISNKKITFNNIEEGVDFMKFVSWNSYKETNAWAYKENNSEKLDIGAWDKNTEKKSFQPSYPRNPIFNIHTHPGTRDGYGGESRPSTSDWEAYSKHPYNTYYILTQKHGLIIYGIINGVKGYFTPLKKNTPKHLAKFRLK